MVISCLLLHAASPEELGYTAARGGTGGLRGTLGGGFAVEHDCFARPVRAAGFPSASALRARLLDGRQLLEPGWAPGRRGLNSNTTKTY